MICLVVWAKTERDAMIMHKYILFLINLRVNCFCRKILAWPVVICVSHLKETKILLFCYLYVFSDGTFGGRETGHMTTSSSPNDLSLLEHNIEHCLQIGRSFLLLLLFSVSHFWEMYVLFPQLRPFPRFSYFWNKKNTKVFTEVSKYISSCQNVLYSRETK